MYFKGKFDNHVDKNFVELSSHNYLIKTKAYLTAIYSNIYIYISENI